MKGFLLLKAFVLMLPITMQVIISHGQSADSTTDQKNGNATFKPSPVFDPNKPGDPYIPNKDGSRGGTDGLAWLYYGKEALIPTLDFGNSGGTYLGCDENGTYSVRNSDGALFRLDDKLKLYQIKEEQLPKTLHNSSVEFDLYYAGNKAPAKIAPAATSKKVFVAGKAVLTGSQGLYELRFEGGTDTTTHKVKLAPGQENAEPKSYYEKAQKDGNTIYRVFVVNKDGKYATAEYPEQVGQMMFGIKTQH